MLTVIIAHYLGWRNVYTFQIENVAVSAFLFISGYLYGNKNIDNRKDWIRNRINRILVPFWIIVLTLAVYLIVKGNYHFAILQTIECFFNLQGVHSVIHIPFALGNWHMQGLIHCWFLTIIMLCYISVIFLKNSQIEKIGDKHPRMLLLLAILLHITFCFINVDIGCFIIFFVGYFYRRLESTNKISYSFFAYLTFAMLVTISIRIALKQIIDGECFYDFFFALFSSNICAIWYFVLVKMLCERNISLTTITAKKSWKWLDNMTYPLYLTHFIFMREPFPPPHTVNICSSSIYVFTLSIASAMILNAITKKFERI